MSAVPKNSFVSATLDDDSQETREWIDALSGVIQNEGCLLYTSDAADE